MIETGAAAVIAVTTYGPFGEPERATGRWLPWLRLGAAVALTAAAFGALAAGATGGRAARRHPRPAPQPGRHDRHRPAVRGRARRRVRLDRPDGLPADHRGRAGRGADHALGLAGPAAARPRRGDLRRAWCSPPGSWPSRSSAPATPAAGSRGTGPRGIGLPRRPPAGQVSRGPPRSRAGRRARARCAARTRSATARRARPRTPRPATGARAPGRRRCAGRARAARP